jgi:hypothetical protein
VCGSHIEGNWPAYFIKYREFLVDAPGNDDKASMLEEVKRPNPWRKKKMMMMIRNFLLDEDLLAFLKLCSFYRVRVLISYLYFNYNLQVKGIHIYVYIITFGI